MAVGSINSAYQVGVKVNQGAKGFMFTKGIAPSTVFSYLNPEGQTNNVTITKYDMEDIQDYKKRVKAADTYLTAMNPYSTENNADITPKEVFQIKENIARNTAGTRIVRCASGSANSLDSTKRNDYFQLLDLYSDDESDGGKNITPQEQSKVVDTFAKWYYQN